MRALIASLVVCSLLVPLTSRAADDACKGADSGSYSAIANCGQSKFEEADRALNQIYQQLLGVLEKEPPRRKLVIESQRAWLTYREKSCEFWQALVTYNVPGCKFGITDQRVKDLKHMHDCFTEGASAC